MTPPRPLASLAPLAVAAAALLAAPAPRAGEFAANHLFVCSEGADVVLEYDAAGALVRSIGAGTGLSAPSGLAFGPDGRLYVASSGNDKVLVYSDIGALVGVVGVGSGLVAPRGLAFGPGGLLHVGSAEGTVHRFAPDGSALAPIGAGAGLVLPADLAFGADGHLFVACAGTGEVAELAPDGALVAGHGGTPDLSMAIGVALGPDGRLAISSGATDAVAFADAAGAVDTLDLSGIVSGSSGLAYGPDGLLYVVARNEARIVALDAQGVVVREFGEGSGLLTGGAAAFAPRRFALKLKGSLTLAGVEKAKLAESGTLSIFPGGRTLMLDVPDGEAADDLATLFGGGALVLRGCEAFQGAGGKHLLDGHARLLAGGAPQFASAVVEVPGKLDQAANFSPKTAGGELVRASAVGVLRANIKTGKALN